MKPTCKRITAFALVLLMTLSLLASCSDREVESEELIPRILDLPLEEGEVVLDILEADENYRVLVGMPDRNPEHTYLPTDELGGGNDYI